MTLPPLSTPTCPPFPPALPLGWPLWLTSTPSCPPAPLPCPQVTNVADQHPYLSSLLQMGYSLSARARASVDNLSLSHNLFASPEEEEGAGQGQGWEEGPQPHFLPMVPWYRWVAARDTKKWYRCVAARGTDTRLHCWCAHPARPRIYAYTHLWLPPLPSPHLAPPHTHTLLDCTVFVPPSPPPTAHVHTHMLLDCPLCVDVCSAGRARTCSRRCWTSWSQSRSSWGALTCGRCR